MTGGRAMIRRLALAVALTAAPLAAGAEPVVLAAASTAAALDAAIAESGVVAVAGYGASGTLARQIEQGAPADLFVSANPEWMDRLVEVGLAKADEVAVLMSNRLVLIAPEGAAPLPADLDAATLAARLGDESFVMGDPAAAPVGVYGKAALESLGLWAGVAPRFVPVRNTTAAVAAVTRGEAALGLVYLSDAQGQAGATVVWEAPTDSHPPIRYLVAPLAQGPDPEGARRLLDFLAGPDGRRILADHGFATLEEGN